MIYLILRIKKLLSILTESSCFLHDQSPLVISILGHKNVFDAQREPLRVKKVGEHLRESRLQLAGIFSPVELKKCVHQTELRSTVLIFVKNAWKIGAMKRPSENVTSNAN